MATYRTDSLIFVIDTRWCIQRLFQASCTEEWTRSPLQVYLAHRFRNLNIRLSTHFLHDKRHREERSEVVWCHRLFCTWMQNWFWRFGKIGHDVVPRTRHFIFS